MSLSSERTRQSMTEVAGTEAAGAGRDPAGSGVLPVARQGGEVRRGGEARPGLLACIIGIGNTVADLEGLQRLLAATDRSCDIAFVVVCRQPRPDCVHQPGDAHQPGHAPEEALQALLEASDMPVVAVRSRIVLRRGRIHLVSPGRVAGFRDGMLTLRRLRKGEDPCTRIDSAFSAAAAAFGASAACAVLSGPGSEGVAGLRAVARAGGLTLVEHPDGAASPEMPRRAIAAGPVDHVLPAGAMAAVLRRWATGRLSSCASGGCRPTPARSPGSSPGSSPGPSPRQAARPLDRGREAAGAELASLRDELAAARRDLAKLTAALRGLDDDLAHLSEATGVAAVFFDRALRVSRFTRGAAALLALDAESTGQPLATLRHRLQDPALVADARRALRAREPQQREVAWADGRWSLRRLLPCRRSDGTIAGVILALTDITEAKRSSLVLARRAARLGAISAISAQALRGEAPAAVLARATELAAELLDVEAVLLLRLDGDGEAEVLAHHGPGRAEAQRICSDRAPHLARAVLAGAAGPPARANEAGADGDPSGLRDIVDVSDLVAGGPFDASWLVPIPQAESAFGGFLIFARGQGGLSDDDRMFAAAIAGLAGIVATRWHADDASAFERDRALAIVDAVRTPVVLLDDRLRVVSGSRAFFETFGVEQGAGSGTVITAAGDGSGSFPEITEWLNALIASGHSSDTREVAHEFPQLGYRIMRLSAHTIRHPGERRRYVVVSFEDLTEQRQVEWELLEGKDIAERAVSAKAQFLAEASHDLRQPLQAAMFLLEMLNDRRNNAQTAEVLSKAIRALTSVSDLLDDVLEFSRLEAGILAPSVSDFPLQPLVDSVVEQFEGQAAAKGVALRVVPCHAVVRSDRHLLRRLLSNLVSNAVAYTETGRILVGCRRRGGELVVQVRDTGIGFSPHEHERIFDAYYRVDATAPGVSGQGLGLGLTIVAQLSKLLDHPISVQSSPGRGSVFGVGLPMTENLRKRERLRAAREPARAGGRAGGGAGAADRGPVVVIGDDPDVLKRLSRMLEGDGNDVLGASTARDALELIARDGRCPSLLVLDLQLPDGRNGVEMVRVFRSRVNADVPAILLTAEVVPDQLREADAAGILVLGKPISPAYLLAVVETVSRGVDIGGGGDGSPGPAA